MNEFPGFDIEEASSSWKIRLLGRPRPIGKRPALNGALELAMPDHGSVFLQALSDYAARDEIKAGIVALFVKLTDCFTTADSGTVTRCWSGF